MGTKLEPRLIYSLSCFAFQNRESQEDTYRLYNAWVNETHIRLNYIEAKWVLDYIQLVQKCEPETFKKALEFDRKRLHL